MPTTLPRDPARTRAHSTPLYRIGAPTTRVAPRGDRLGPCPPPPAIRHAAVLLHYSSNPHFFNKCGEEVLFTKSK